MERNISLDILKVILALLVVALHTSFLKDLTSIGKFLVCEGVCRIAVPIFILINGFYFYNITINKKYSIWFKKILFLYIFWMLIYSYFWFIKVDNIFIIIKTIFFGYFHLWYLPGIMGAAVITYFTKDLRVEYLFFLVVFTFIIGVTLQYSANYHLINNIKIDKFLNDADTHRNFLFFVFPFFMIGFLMNKYTILEKINIKILLVITIIGFLLLLLESYYNYLNFKFINQSFDMYYSLIISAPFIFMIFMKIDGFKGYTNLSLYSSGIYFAHPFVFLALRRFFVDNETILTFITICLSYLISIFLIVLNKKFKIIL